MGTLTHVQRKSVDNRQPFGMCFFNSCLILVRTTPSSCQSFLTGAFAGTRKHSIQEATNTHVLKGHEGAVLDCCFHPDSSILASSSEDGTVRLWKIRESSLSCDKIVDVHLKN